MDNKIAEDIGEEIISKLKELNRILERLFIENKNEKNIQNTPAFR